MSTCLESLLDAARRAECEANDAEMSKPANMKLCLNPHWKYTPASETNVQATWRRAGWMPAMALRVPR